MNQSYTSVRNVPIPGIYKKDQQYREQAQEMDHPPESTNKQD